MWMGGQHHNLAAVLLGTNGTICIGAGWAQGPVWWLWKFSPPNGIRCPDCLSFSKSMYQLLHQRLIETKKTKTEYLTIPNSGILHFELPTVCTLYII